MKTPENISFSNIFKANENKLIQSNLHNLQSIKQKLMTIPNFQDKSNKSTIRFK